MCHLLSGKGKGKGKAVPVLN